MREAWVLVGTVAIDLRVRKDSIDRWIEHSGLPATKIGKLWNLKLLGVDAWILASSRSGAKLPGAGSLSGRVAPRRAGSQEEWYLSSAMTNLIRNTRL